MRFEVSSFYRRDLRGTEETIREYSYFRGLDWLAWFHPRFLAKKKKRRRRRRKKISFYIEKISKRNVIEEILGTNIVGSKINIRRVSLLINIS